MSTRGVEVALFLLALWPALYWNNGANIPQISRLDVVYSFVEPGTPDSGSFRIDRFVRTGRSSANTIDWARNRAWGIEAYSNKAPGLQLAAIPVYAAIFHGARAMGIRPDRPEPSYVIAWLLNVLVQGPLGALLTVVFYRLVRRNVGLPPLAAAGLALALWYGSGLAPFHTQLWGHTPTAALAALSLLALVGRSPATAGAFAGLGVLVDYSAVLPLLTLVGWLALRRDLRGLARFALGGLPPFLLYAGYHYACFGNPLAPALLYNNPLFLERRAAGGILDPSVLAEALWGLSFSPYRGVFSFWPLCAGAFAALAFARRLRDEPLFWLSLANVALFLLANACFNGWDGGSTFGPRYQIPALPFYGLLLAFAMRELSAVLRERPRARAAAGAAAATLVAVSLWNALLGQAVSPLAPSIYDPGPKDVVDWSRPIAHHTARLARGEVQPFPLLGIRSPHDTPAALQLRTWNLGGLLGLGGFASVALYLAIAAGAATWTLRRAARLG